MKILIGGEFSGIIRNEFAKLGHEVISCDYLDSEILGNHYKGDMMDIIDFPFDLGIFHPPCTHTSVSGAPHFEEKKQDGRYYQGVSFFLYLWKRVQHIPKVCFEHPVSTISTYFRKPDQYINPFEHGHKISKKTGLWLRGLPLLKPSEIVKSEWIYYSNGGRCSPDHYKNAFSKDRGKLRSRTYPGIAKAMAEQWGE